MVRAIASQQEGYIFKSILGSFPFVGTSDFSQQPKDMHVVGLIGDAKSVWMTLVKPDTGLDK